MNIFVRARILKHCFLYVRWWFSKFVDVLLLKKTKLRFLLAPIKILNNPENYFINPLHQHYSSDFDSEIYIKPPVACAFLAYFQNTNERWTLENIDQSGRRREFNIQKVLIKLTKYLSHETQCVAWMSENHNQPILQIEWSFKPYFYSTVCLWDYSSLE